MTAPFDLLLAALGMLAAMASPAFATSYSAAPMSAKVVDAETGQPLEGASVVASWMVVSVTGRTAGNMTLMEAATGPDGVFHLPAWGPKPISRNLPSGSRMVGDSPELAIFTSGYEVKFLHNHSSPDHIKDPTYLGDPVRRSDWDGKTIALAKFNGSMEQYAFQATSLVSRVNSGGEIRCPFLNLPKAFRALRLEKQRLDAGGIRNTLPDARRVRYWIDRASCPAEDTRAFLEEYEK